ncbi:MAG: peptidoglycan-binding protein [Ilumatobacteraceae bacterium]|nr:peptidoglycan-binding protein [Ilumatobacteraceae bacterium]
MHNTSRSRRHVIASISIGALLALGPMLPSSAPVSADAPAVSVTGLSRGSRGDAVKSVQQALVGQGLEVTGGVDGIFGPGTESALKSFQQQQGLSASGVVDDATALALGLTSSSLLGLTQGNRGKAVTKLQQRLVNAGIDVAGGVDGIFGQGTQRAVKSFQSKQGFSPTGVVDAATAAALEAVSGSTPELEAPEVTDEPAAQDDTSSSLVGLKIGSRNDRVKELQRTLMAAGFTVVGGADGIFGALTANALKSFQNANGLGTTGVVDDATAKVLSTIGSDGSEHDPEATNPFVGLQYGSIGADVKALQSALIDAGIHVRGGADGVFGTATQAAVKAFQVSQGLDQSGKVDEKTASAISSGATSSGGSALTGLKTGALGNTVKSLQQALIDAGINVRGGADGIFGPATANAVKEFQTSQGLEATGVVNAKTAEALADPQKPTPSTPAAAGGFAAYGEKGARVIALQSALVRAGVTLRGGVDGDFGGGTSAAVMDFQRANGLGVTGKVSDATAEKLGLERMPEPSAPDPSTVELEVFPVQGKCYYGDSWGYPRGGGRVHLGVDIIAPEGKLLYAVADGTITKVYADYPGSLSGNGVRLTMADGTYFFYAHMVGVADGIDVGTKVKAGQIVGAVGNTGNSGTAHLHFEVHPQGGAAVNPYPMVKAIDACGNETPLPQP